MRYLVVILLLIFSLTSLADSPPAYQPFSVNSSNSKFIAKVNVSDKNGMSYPWEWEYSLKVFNMDSPLIPIWESKYKFDGYQGGILSNDGTHYAYVSFWYFDEGPILYIYKKGSIKSYSANALKISSVGLRKTASHQLWLKGGIRFWPESGETTTLIIDTTQGERKVDLQ